MCSVLIVCAIGVSERKKERKGMSKVTNMEIQQAAKDESFLNAISAGISRRRHDELWYIKLHLGKYQKKHLDSEDFQDIW